MQKIQSQEPNFRVCIPEKYHIIYHNHMWDNISWEDLTSVFKELIYLKNKHKKKFKCNTKSNLQL